MPRPKKYPDELIRPAGEKAAVDKVLADPNAGHPDRGPAATAPDHAREPGLAHQALDALAADPDAVGHAQLGVDPGRSVDAPVRPVDLADAIGGRSSSSARADGARLAQA